MSAKPSIGADRVSAGPFRIGALITPNDAYWVQVLEAVRHATRAIGDELVVLQPAASLASLLKIPADDLVDQVLAHELDALILAVDSPAILQTLVDERLPPVVNLSEIELQHPLFMSSGSLYDGGVVAGRYVGERLGGRGHALCVTAGLETILITGQNRYEGFRDALQAFPGVQVASLPAFWSYEQAYEALLDAFAAYRAPVDAIFGVSDAVILAARDAGRVRGVVTHETVLVGLNGDAAALAAIAAGELSATVDTASEDLAAQSVRLAHAAAQGYPLPSRIERRYQLITRDTLADVALRKLVAIADLPYRMLGRSPQQEMDRLTQLESVMQITPSASNPWSIMISSLGRSVIWFGNITGSNGCVSCAGQTLIRN